MPIRPLFEKGLPIPIGTFSLGYFSPIHASPSEAVIIHKHVRSHKSIGVHWGCRDLGDIVGIGATATLKPAQVSSKVTEVWVRLDGWKYDVLQSIHTPNPHLPPPQAARKIIEMLRWSSEIWEWERHEEPTDGSLQRSSSADVELGIL